MVSQATLHACFFGWFVIALARNWLNPDLRPFSCQLYADEQQPE